MNIVFNPVAGRRRTQAFWRVLDILSANGVRVDLLETRFPGHAETLAREAVAAGAELVVAAGGDGTIAEVANGLIGSGAKLGVIPIGTANVLAHELDLPFSPRGIAAALAFGRTRVLWPGMMSGAEGERLFTQMIGVGFDGHVVHRVSPGMKRVLGRGAYALCALRALAVYPFTPIMLRIDGCDTQTCTAIVSKGRFYGGAHLLARDACAAQPGFSVSLFDRSSPWAAMMHGMALPFGLVGRMRGVRQMRAREIVFTGNSHVPAQSDGDAAGSTPLSITDAPMPIRVVTG